MPENKGKRPSGKALLQHLQRIQASAVFVESRKPAEILDFMVREFIAGRHEAIKREVIAHEVFKNQDTAVVGATIGRLRKKLDEYYRTVGEAEAIRIEIALNTCVPRIWMIEGGASETKRFEESAHERPREPRLWNIPHRSSLFCGREVYLASLRSALPSDTDSAICVFAITGLGGIGKTHTAIEYAHRYRSEYTAALWLDATSLDTLLVGFHWIARTLEIPGFQADKPRGLFDSVRWWLESNPGWLLVFDNLESFAGFARFLPSRGGHCLVTTRSSFTGGLARGAELPPLDPTDSLSLLLRRSGQHDGNSPSSAPLAFDLSAAEEIAERLGGLPLALDQAGAFIEETHSSLTDYLAYYRAQGATLRGRRGESPTHRLSVSATYSLALSRLKEKSHVSLEILRVLAFLAPNEVPEELFTLASEDGGHAFEEFQPALTFLENVAVLARFGLVRRNPTNRTISVHNLVQEIVKDGMQQQERDRWVFRICSALVTALTSVDADRSLALLATHSLVLLGHMEHKRFDSPSLANLLWLTGQQLQVLGNYNHALSLLKRALQICEALFGDDSLETAHVLTSLGSLHATLGQNTEAELLLERAISIYKQEDPDDEFFVIALGSLATVLHLTGRSLEATHNIDQSLAIVHAGPETDATAYAFTLSRRALLLIDESRHAEAESVIRDALDSSPDRGIELVLWMQLAAIHLRQRSFTEAEALYRKALIHAEEHLGAEHPETATILSKVGLALIRQARYEEAEVALNRSKVVLVRVLGPEHLRVSQVLENFARLFAETGQFAQAKQILLDLISSSRLDEHLLDQRLILADELGVKFQESGCHDGALEIYMAGLAAAEAQFSKAHNQVPLFILRTRECLRIKGDYTEARFYAEKLISIAENKVPKDDVLVATLLQQLGVILHEGGEPLEALKIQERAFERLDKTVGLNSEKTAHCINRMGLALFDLGDFENAELYFDNAADILEKILGSDHEDTIKCRDNHRTALERLAEL